MISRLEAVEVQAALKVFTAEFVTVPAGLVHALCQHFHFFSAPLLFIILTASPALSRLEHYPFSNGLIVNIRIFRIKKWTVLLACSPTLTSRDSSLDWEFQKPVTQIKVTKTAPGTVLYYGFRQDASDRHSSPPAQMNG
jgi:hypothetical protein